MASSLVPPPRLAADVLSLPEMKQANESEIKQSLIANPPTGATVADGKQALLILQNHPSHCMGASYDNHVKVFWGFSTVRFPGHHLDGKTICIEHDVTYGGAVNIINPEESDFDVSRSEVAVYSVDETIALFQANTNLERLDPPPNTRSEKRSLRFRKYFHIPHGSSSTMMKHTEGVTPRIYFLEIYATLDTEEKREEWKPVTEHFQVLAVAETTGGDTSVAELISPPALVRRDNVVMRCINNALYQVLPERRDGGTANGLHNLNVTLGGGLDAMERNQQEQLQHRSGPATKADKSEQKLREKIASQKAALAELPSLVSIVDRTGLMSPETKARAQQIKELSDIEEELELLIESKRVGAVISLQDELHPPEDSGDCPICLESIKHVNNMTISRLYCCGGWICEQCFEEREAKVDKKGIDEMLSGKCPLCRETFVSGKEAGLMVLEHSKKGKAWAQYLIGTMCLDTTRAKEVGLSFDGKKCRDLIERAADQGDPHALFFMSKQYGDEDMNKLHYLKRAADIGYALAQYNLALFYGMNNEVEKFLHYLTLAASQGYYKACSALGDIYLNAECDLTHSYILAIHYAGKSLDYDLSVYNLSFASYDQEVDRFEGITDIPGHSPIPTFLFWGRRAAEGSLEVEMKDFLTKRISEVEDYAKSRCANCRKDAGCSSFKRCVRCLGAWYCGKECQVQHWKAGHKIDCIKRGNDK